jgi:arabinose-5-phosphate isomerase
MNKTESFIDHAKTVLTLEADALSALLPRLNKDFDNACRIISSTTGRVVVTGMGKSGHVGSKIAATLASTGTPAFFVHPGEASHGDLGMITPDDVVLALSNSGETNEILTILPIIKRMGVKLIAFTGQVNSSLGKQADAVINVGVDKEACPLNLAPTSSTTAAMAMGDAMAVAIYKSHGFTEEDFARSHPGGQLGRRLLIFVKDIMHAGDAIPCVDSDASLRAALLEMTGKGLGMTAVTDKENKLVGILTDGDLRRILGDDVDIHTAKISDVMIKDPKVTHADRLAAETVQQMQELNINGLFVVDDKSKVVGAFNMLDLLRAGIV